MLDYVHPVYTGTHITHRPSINQYSIRPCLDEAQLCFIHIYQLTGTDQVYTHQSHMWLKDHTWYPHTSGITHTTWVYEQVREYSPHLHRLYGEVDDEVSTILCTSCWYSEGYLIVRYVPYWECTCDTPTVCVCKQYISTIQPDRYVYTWRSSVKVYAWFMYTCVHGTYGHQHWHHIRWYII